MKATLEFNLPEEQTEHLQAVMAGRAWGALYDIDNTIRRYRKGDVPVDLTLTMLQNIINDTNEGMQ